MFFMLLPMTLAAGLPAARGAEAAPQPPPTEDTWDLSHIFADVSAWEEGLTRAREAIGTVELCRGQLTSSARSLVTCMAAVDGAELAVGRAWVYASSHAAVDGSDPVWQERQARAGLLWTELSEATSWIAPAILELGEEQLQAYLEAEPALAPWAYPLRSILEDAEHVLSPEEEALLAATGTLRQSPGEVFNLLVTTELPWPTVELSDGTEVRVDRTGYAHHRASAVRSDRLAVYEAFYGALADYEATLGGLLNTAVGAHWLVARTRGYESSVEAALAGDHLPTEVYDALVEGTAANLPTLHRYLELRRRMLDLDELSYADLYVPLVEGEWEYSLEEARELTLASSQRMGREYVEVLERGFGERWMDAWPGEHKRAGAYMTDAARDVHPYVLMNYTGDYGSVSTLAHEWGHAVHSALSTEAQPYPTADYATFIAEIASTFAEALLLDHLLQEVESDEERLFYLGYELEKLRGTYFRQAMFGEFELALHERVEADQPLTGSAISEIYLDILRRYHGHGQGVTTIDESYGKEWAYVHHFFHYDFYVFQYATSLAASSMLVEPVLQEEEGAIERYLELLRAGGSDDPYELLKRAGVDMATTEPYEALDRRMNAIMDEMEQILDD